MNGSMPINTIFRGLFTSIWTQRAILMWTTGLQGFEPSPFMNGLSMEQSETFAIRMGIQWLLWWNIILLIRMKHLITNDGLLLWMFTSSLVIQCHSSTPCTIETCFCGWWGFMSRKTALKYSVLQCPSEASEGCPRSKITTTTNEHKWT